MNVESDYTGFAVCYYGDTPVCIEAVDKLYIFLVKAICKVAFFFILYSLEQCLVLFYTKPITQPIAACL